MSDAGEIVARLRLDAGNWFEELDRAEAKARELGGVDPKVRVSAEGTAKTVAELTALRGDVARLSAESASIKVTTTGTAKAVADLAAMQAAAAKIAADTSSIKVRTEGAAKAIYELDGVWAATQALSREQTALGTAYQGSWSTAQSWVSLIGGLGPALIPVAAGTVGLTAAVGEFGGAAVLAVLGIKNAMAAGTGMGQQYSAMFDGLTSGLQHLEQTSAAGVLTGLSAAIGSVQQAMPFLNGQMSVFSQLLGSSAAAAVSGLVTGLETMSPLLLQSGTYLQHVVAGLAGFASSNAFEGFVQYSVANLPTVEQLLNTLVIDSAHLLAALAPLGTVALDVVTALTTGLSAIPVPVLTGLAGGALTAFAAFKTWGALAPILNSIEMALGPVSAETAAYVALLGSEEGVMAAVTAGEADMAAATLAAGSAFDFAAGPVGIVFAALGGLAAAFAGVVAGNQQAAAATTDYTAALTADNGALGTNTTAQVANALAKAGAFEKAKLLGIDQATLTQATLGNAGALHTVNGVLATTQQQYAKTGEGGRGLSKSQQQVMDAANGVRSAIGNQASALHTQITQYRDVAAATGSAGTATAGYSGKLSATTPITADLTAAQQAQVQALHSVAEGFRADTSAAEAMANSYDDATIASGQLIASLKASKGNLNEDTVAGAQNAEGFRSAIGKIKAHADALNSDGQHAAAARAYTLQHARSLEQQAVAAGADKGKVDSLVGSLINVSRQHPVSKIDVQTAQFAAKVAAIRSQMAAINGLTSTVYVNAIASGVSQTAASVINRQSQLLGGHADGGTIQGHADGGTIYGPGSASSDSVIRRLSVGEEVISNRHGQADAFRGVLKAINAGTVRTPAQLRSVTAGGAQQGPQHVTNRAVNVGGIHIHNPVAVDPVAQAAEAAQMALAYAGIG